MKEGFIIYKSFYEPLRVLSDDQIGRLFRAIFEYQINGTTKVDNDIKMGFEFFKNQFRIDDEKYDKRCKKNQENIEKYWKNKENKQDTNEYNRIQMNTKHTDKDKENEKENVKDNENVNEKVNENENENENVKEKEKKTNMSSKLDGAAASVLDYMNEIAKRDFKHIKSNLDLIKARLSEGFTVEDCKDVIFNQKRDFLDRKLKKGDKDLSKYYRPMTLFGENFESYLQDYKQYDDRGDK